MDSWLRRLDLKLEKKWLYCILGTGKTAKGSPKVTRKEDWWK
jgi:hypothetical protein